MEYIKKNWKVIVIVLLTLFSLSKCTTSCSRGTEIDRLNLELTKKDSIIIERNCEIDTLHTNIRELNYVISLCETKIEGYQQQLKIKDDAIEQINKAKQNINVTVRQKQE